MEDFVVFLFGMFIGYLFHVYLLVRKFTHDQKSDGSDEPSQLTVLVEKHDSVFYVYDDATNTFLAQNVCLEHAILHAMGDHNGVKILVKTDDLKNEVIALLEKAKTDIAVSPNP